MAHFLATLDSPASAAALERTAATQSSISPPPGWGRMEFMEVASAVKHSARFVGAAKDP